MTFRVTGSKAEARVFSERVDMTAFEQIKEMMNSPVAEGSHARIMPDYHAGAGSVVGTTMHVVDKVVPNLVGNDIGCGVYVRTFQLIGELTQDQLKTLDEFIKNEIPSGRKVYDHDMTKMNEIRREHMQFESDKFITPGLGSKEITDALGTLGGGNHFIELALSSINGQPFYHLLIHSGSRYVGAKVAGYFQKLAKRNMSKPDLTEEINKMKEEGRHREIQDFIINAKKEYQENLPNMDLAYLEDKDLEDYLHDMKIAQEFAYFNRKEMSDKIIKFIIENFCVREHDYEESKKLTFDSIHNYIDIENRILRKGATAAYKDQMLVIPLNMRDGSLLCRGKGNEEWNNSAPHGAGRLYSRTKAMQELSMEDFYESMEGIFTTSVNNNTLDEAPMAYKPASEIIEAIGDTAEVITIMKPVYNFKASERED